MNKKSFQNAILAAGYISFVVLFINFISSLTHSPEDNIFMPMAMLATLVLSVSVMAFLFFYEPVMFLMEGKREEAIKFFISTVSIFAVITAIFVTLAMFVFPLL